MVWFKGYYNTGPLKLWGLLMRFRLVGGCLVLLVISVVACVGDNKNRSIDFEKLRIEVEDLLQTRSSLVRLQTETEALEQKLRSLKMHVPLIFDEVSYNEYLKENRQVAKLLTDMVQKLETQIISRIPLRKTWFKVGPIGGSYYAVGKYAKKSGTLSMLRTYGAYEILEIKPWQYIHSLPGEDKKQRQ